MTLHEQIVRMVALEFDLAEADILGPSRSRSTIHARQLAMWLSYQSSSASLPELGRFYARNHTTVLSSVRRVEGRFQADAQFAEAADALIMRLRLRGGGCGTRLAASAALRKSEGGLR